MILKLKKSTIVIPTIIILIFSPIAFANTPPNPITEPNIEPNQKDVSINTALSWTGGGDPDAGDQVVYNIYFGFPDDMHLVATTNQTSYEPGPLEEKTTYCWRVDTVDNHNAVTQGEVWCFTTGFELKEMYLDTSVRSCDNGEFVFDAVIVVPEGLYIESVNQLKALIIEMGGTESDFENIRYTDTTAPIDILETHNVIAIGNMTTNAFIRKLYREWYVLLDLKYPGGDGYVVRTLHNPYATGHNVIFLGGSSEAGVQAAATIFETKLKEYNSLPIPCDGVSNISVPRLMEIELDPSYKLPEIAKEVDGNIVGDIGHDIAFKKWNIATWRDYYRPDESFEINSFGWNPISVAGILYYMTGQTEYLELFKTLAMPDSDNIPAANQSSAFYDPANPLVESYHYHSHLVDLVYDLIEESPDLSDKNRQHITNRLLEHQEYLDPDHTLLKENTDRHGSYDMINIYTGSRYFQKYYPDLSWNENSDPATTVWERRIANARASFNSLIGDPTWGESDTLLFVPTYNEVVFDFFMLDGFDTFVTDTDTGYKTAETMMRYFDITRTGFEPDGYTTFNRLSINLLNKAAHMLDGNYIWLLKELRPDEDNFRIGPSFWHPLANTDPPPAPPADIVNQLTDFPLVQTTWKNANQYLSEELQIEQNEGFQVASFRSGMTKYDNFMQLDGFFGYGRNEMHLNSIYWLRMFGDASTSPPAPGIPILWGYENDVDILYNGLSQLHPPQCAALKTWHYEAPRNMLYLETEVPNMPESVWKRHILYMKDKAAIVIDQITADNPGEFDITCSWSLFKSIFYTDNLPDISTNRSILLSHAGTTDIDIGSAEIDEFGNELREKVKQKTVVELSEGEKITIGNAFSKVGDNSFTIRHVKGQDNVFRLTDGDTHSLLVIGHFENDSFTVDADFAYYTAEMILEVNDGAVQIANQPNPSEFAAMLNNLEIQEDETDEEGDIYVDSKWPEDKIKINWPRAWRQDLSGDSAVKEFAFLDTAGQSYAAVNHEDTSQIFAFSKDTGEILATTGYNSQIFSMQAYLNEESSPVFDLLAGFEDYTLRAYKSDINNGGIDEVWNITTQIHEDVLTVHSPWFTTDVPGVYSILVDDLWDTGKDIIAAGLPCTVEFIDMNGNFIDRVKTVYGPNTSLGLLTDVYYYGRVLLAGKKFTGYPLFTGIIRDDNSEYSNISDSLLYSFSSGDDFTAMQRWNQNGIDQLVIDDIDNDEIQEVVYTLSGHWNELRVHTGNILTSYSNHTTPEWLQYFGGGNSNEDFMKGLAVISQDDGTKTVITATKYGRVYAFTANGDMIWMRSFRRNITCMEAIAPDSSSPKIVVGFENGIITALDKDGNRVLNAKLESAVPQVISYDALNLYCGDSSGGLTALPFANDRRCDINGDGAVTLEDAILALKVMVGETPSGVRSDYSVSGADINGNGRIGAEEVIYILEFISGIR